MRGEQQRNIDQNATTRTITQNRLMLDARGCIVGGDAISFKLLGQSPREAMGRPLTSLLDDSTATKLSETARNMTAKGMIEFGQPISGHVTQSCGGAPVTLRMAPAPPSRARQSSRKAASKVRYVVLIMPQEETDLTPKTATRFPSEGDYDANHLLRTHLNTILGYAELAQEECTQDNPRRREQLAAITSAGRALAAASTRDAKFASVMHASVEPANNAPDTTAPTSSLDSVSPCWIDLSNTLSETRITSLKMRAMHHRARLTVDLQDAPRRVIAGRARLKTAIETLCQFAIDTVGGGGRVLLHVVQLDDGGVAIDIVDDGPGWRLSPNTPLPSRLKNLLSKVRTIMAVDNARVEFQSIPGAGSTARIAFLPESVIS